MSSAVPFPVKKAFLRSLVVSVLLSALLGILAILSGGFGWFEVRVLLTTATVGIASICGLACGAYLATGTGRALPRAGIALSLAGAAMIIAGAWLEVESKEFWKLAASICVFAVACAHLSLLSMARLAEWFQWSIFAAHAAVFGVAALITTMILFEIGEQGMFQLLAVAAIVDAALTVLVPVFHRLSRSESASAASQRSIDAEIAKLKKKLAELESLKERST